MENQIQQLAIVLSIAAVVGGIAKMLRLPMILAYLVAGALLSASGAVSGMSSGMLGLFSDMGIMMLLFLIGLEINYASLRMVGATAMVVGAVQIVITGVLGALFGLLVGWDPLTVLYVSIMVGFASTVVVVKTLTERHDLNSLHGKIVVGIMLVQDFIAMIVLVALAGLKGGGGFDGWPMLLTILKAAVLFSAMLWLGRSFIPKLLHRLSLSHELLFLLAMAWMFVVAAVCHQIGLSIEIGGFLAGLALANASDQLHIAHNLRPLRDFFLILLFISLGTSLSGQSFSGQWGMVIGMTVLVTIVNPAIITWLLYLRGYHPRTSVLAGLHVSQLSEFSLVVATIGVRLGHIPDAIVSYVTIAAILSIAISSFGMAHADAVYTFIRPVFGARGKPQTTKKRAKKYELVLIGAHRLGQNILRSVDKKSVLVIDYDPDVIARLQREHIDVTYGDVSDEEMIDALFAHHPKTIVCTSPDDDDTVGLLTALRGIKRPHPLMIVRAETEREAARYYRLGADFVLLPHLMSGLSIGQLLHRHDRALLQRWRTNDLTYLAHHAHE